MLVRLLMAVLLSACSSGPESGSQRLAVPASTPFADWASGWNPDRRRPPCLVNRSDLTVAIRTGLPGRERERVLAPGATLALETDARVGFASVGDGKDRESDTVLRFRLYRLPAAPPAVHCRWQLRSAPDGSLDLFETAA